MSFTDNLKKSLGFEEDDFGSAYGVGDYGDDIGFIDDEDEFTSISPEQTFYEIILILCTCPAKTIKTVSRNIQAFLQISIFRNDIMQKFRKFISL